MREILQTIISNILTALYQPFWYAVLASVLLCFLHLYAYYPVNTGKGLKVAIKTWMKEFRKSVFFRKLFVLSFFTVMILFQTLFNRNMWTNPLSNIMGGWWIWETVNGEKKLTTECFENLVLMLPFVFLLFGTFEEKLGKISMKRIVGKGLKIAFIFSFTIEMLQLFLRLGTWQISDLCYNTVGGGLGGALFYGYYRLKKEKRGE
mgnify:FL=1